MPKKVPSTKTTFKLKKWYPGQEAKRNLAKISQEVNRKDESICLLGSEEEPYLRLINEDRFPTEKHRKYLKTITIEYAKKNWSAVTAAALFYDIPFLIHGKKVPRAVLMRHETYKHPGVILREEYEEQSLVEQAKPIRKLLEDINERETEVFEEIKERLDSIQRLVADNYCHSK